MKKEFWKWHKVKEKLNDREDYAYFYAREIWFCSLGINIGHEQDGKYERFERPVIIFRKLTRTYLKNTSWLNFGLFWLQIVQISSK